MNMPTVAGCSGAADEAGDANDFRAENLSGLPWLSDFRFSHRCFFDVPLAGKTSVPSRKRFSLSLIGFAFSDRKKHLA